MKSNRSSYYRIKYEHILKQRGKKRTKIAIARMILTAIYHKFVTGEEFNPNNLLKLIYHKKCLKNRKIKLLNRQ
ncbi:hypothetical protein PQ689_05945 [Thermoanaerobacterium thermosaccharolyticum]|uniref:hypothetical protein n=1 Tax=Thermoanaerobacterium thermosaccharolyticum TaxID=1517 RepID=UPI003DA9B403